MNFLSLMLAHFHESRRNVLILRMPPGGGFGERRRIDVWWGGLQANGGLMMVLAYLLATSVEWADAEVNVKLVVPTAAGADAARANLRAVMEHLRMDAHAEVFVGAREAFPGILRESSAGADLVLLGMAEPGADFRAYYDGLQEMTAGLPPTLFVLAAEEMAFREVLL